MVLPDYDLFQHKNRSNWYFLFRDPATGQRVQRSARTRSKTVAATKAEEFLASAFASEGRVPARETITVVNLFDRYVKYKRAKRKPPRPDTVRTWKDSFNQLAKFVGEDRDIALITASDCESFIDERPHSDYSAKKHYCTLKQAFEWASTRKDWCKSNPFDYVDKPQVRRKIVDCYSDDDFEHLVDVLPESTWYERRLKAMVVVGFLTGIRLSELLNLSHDALWLDGPEARLMVMNTNTFLTKNGLDRKVGLADRVIAALRSILAENRSHEIQSVRNSLYVFPSERGGVLTKAAVTNPLRQTVVKEFPGRKLRFHSLRHGFGTKLALAGVNPLEIMALMGHCSVEVTQLYFHLAGMSFHDSVAALNRKAGANNRSLPYVLNMHGAPSDQEMTIRIS